MHFQINHLSSLGGVGAREVIGRIMCSLMSNPLSACYNWYGKGQKKGIGNLKIARAIKGKQNLV